MNLTAVIIEDQPLARTRLRDLLLRVGGVDVVAEAPNAEEGLHAIRAFAPDVVFLDIQMPGTSGLDLLRACSPRPHAILTTAHADYAVEAFELAADDYLLKPFGRDRLAAAVSRARERIARDRRIESPDEGEGRNVLDRVFVHERGRIVPVRLTDAHHFEGCGDYVRIWVGNRAHLLRQTLASLEERLDPSRFLRVHRSHIVNLDRIRSVRRYDGARFVFDLTNEREVVSARSRCHVIRERLGL